MLRELYFNVWPVRNPFNSYTVLVEIRKGSYLSIAKIPSYYFGLNKIGVATMYLVEYASFETIFGYGYAHENSSFVFFRFSCGMRRP